MEYSYRIRSVNNGNVGSVMHINDLVIVKWLSSKLPSRIIQNNNILSLIFHKIECNN